MATVDGKTPEQIAAEIIKKAVEKIQLKLDGVRGQELDFLVKYRNARDIFTKGEKWFNDNIDRLRSEFLENTIESQYKSLEKQQKAAAAKDAIEYYQLLVSKGVDKAKAMEMAKL